MSMAVLRIHASGRPASTLPSLHVRSLLRVKGGAAIATSVRIGITATIATIATLATATIAASTAIIATSAFVIIIAMISPS